MNVELVNSNSNEVNVSIKDGDIGILYLIQHELLKNKEIDFAGVIMKHPSTNEIWMRVNSKKNPISQISTSTDSVITAVNDLKKLVNNIK
jgi:DNA-directed RNA polymerase subunit L